MTIHSMWMTLETSELPANWRLRYRSEIPKSNLIVKKKGMSPFFFTIRLLLISYYNEKDGVISWLTSEWAMLMGRNSMAVFLSQICWLHCVWCGKVRTHRPFLMWQSNECALLVLICLVNLMSYVQTSIEIFYQAAICEVNYVTVSPLIFSTGKFIFITFESILPKTVVYWDTICLGIKV